MEIQRRLGESAWPGSTRVSARLGIHTGPAAAGLLPYFDSDLQAPLAEMERAVATFREEEDGVGLATTLGMLGTIMARMGRTDDATLFFDESVDVARRVDIPVLVGVNLTLKALGSLAAGDVAGAGLSLEVAAASPLHPQGAIQWLEGFAAVMLEDGDIVRAATAYGAAEALRERTGVKMWPIMHEVFATRLAAIDDGGSATESARFAGRQMSPETAMSFLLDRGTTRAELV